MKYVLKKILKNKQTYSNLPLFQHMRDSSLTEEERLGFYPCMAHFILSFGDINKYMLREEPTTNIYQEQVNIHTYEDDHHWPWYLEDFTKLGFDHLCSPTSWMRFLWSDETRQNRILTYRLAALISGASAVERIAIIEAIEETGNVLFSTMLNLAKAIEIRRGIELRYCGEFHFGRESGHSVGSDRVEIAKIQLDESTQARCLSLVDEIFALFESWAHELLCYAKGHSLLVANPSIRDSGFSIVP
ncbi:MAG: hypothetical protein EAZ60_19685 [Oscillatoriales cyanobacterium]|nr:MAG: hypothetical protein EAZ83_02155 [Oscillatoriales cyanobacterium]TAE98426.1 MAG: hypothetical protein EAZ79_07775 [Oscillatoriales cyanobacterium]TAF23349.1 MAG: hypothetical protein EAZ73_02495 [Oscillatoriales cyanobacterium]TAF35620.1 MAG: hypothetical protein EAZ69_12780 [Oscillatoriales cyanobacterium]TAF53614.1 MAG: hypothetical protein EAZ60_19685 [Oscillatoriales cyanobacterium]